MDSKMAWHKSAIFSLISFRFGEN